MRAANRSAKRYLNIDPGAGSIEVGGIVYAPAFQRVVAATEAMYLMMRRALNQLGYRRYAWQCNSLNARSRAAAMRRRRRCRRRNPRSFGAPGLTLNPLDVADPDQMAWLKALVWPEQTDRSDRLDAAIRIAAADPPRVVKGDLRHDLAALCAEAPTSATLVIFHTAVLAYVTDRAERAEFAEAMASLCDFWIANEALHVFSEVAARVDAGSPRPDLNTAGSPIGGGRLLLSVNGNPVGWADAHGAWLDWIADPIGVRPRVRTPAATAPQIG